MPYHNIFIKNATSILNAQRSISFLLFFHSFLSILYLPSLVFCIIHTSFSNLPLLFLSSLILYSSYLFSLLILSPFLFFQTFFFSSLSLSLSFFLFRFSSLIPIEIKQISLQLSKRKLKSARQSAEITWNRNYTTSTVKIKIVKPRQL